MEGMEGMFEVLAELLVTGVEFAAEGNPRCGCVLLALFALLSTICIIVMITGGN